MGLTKLLRLRGTFCFALAFTLSYFQWEGIYRTSSAHAATENPSTKEQKVPPTAGLATITPVPDQLEALSRSAEEIYNLAKGEKWKKIEMKLEALKVCYQNLKLIQNEVSIMLLPLLSKTMVDLEEAISAKNKMDTMRLANKITLIETAMVGPLNPRVPTSVGLLDYYGRELEIWSAAQNTDRLSYIVIRMHLTWQNLMPLLITKGETKEIRKFAEVMNRLEKAKTPEEYGHLVTLVHDEVDNLEKVFKKNSPH